MLSTRSLLLRSTIRSFSSSSSIASTPLPTTEEIPQLLPYHVRRTNSSNLPVFGEVKNAGQRYLTLIRKIDGDVNALMHDINEQFPQADAFVKPQARQVVLKGNYVNNVKEWLSARGF